MSAMDDSPQPTPNRSRARRRPPNSIDVTDTSPATSPNQETDVSPEVVVIGTGRPPSARGGPPGALLSDARNPLTIAFLLALLVGLLAELFAPAMLGMGLAVGAMGLYFIFGLMTPKTTRNTEKFADSLYYLGFILTLGALFLAMVPSFQSTQITSEAIIEKFGIAILTTFIGMSLRIILLQLRHTTTDQEEEARESITQYVVSLQKEIEHTIDQVRSFRGAVEKDATTSAFEFGQQIREIAQTAGQAIRVSNETMVLSLKQVTLQADQTIQEIVRHLASLDLPTDVFAGRLKASADALSADVDELRRSISNSANSFTCSLAESAAAITRIKSEVDALAQLVASASSSLTQVTKVCLDNHQGFAAAAKESSISIEQLRREASALATALQELQVRLNECGITYEADLANSASQIRSAANDVRGDAETFSKTLLGSATRIRDALRDVKRHE
jgi:hypothetical protein